MRNLYNVSPGSVPVGEYSCEYKVVQMINSFTMSEQAMQDTLIQFSVCTHETGTGSCFSHSSPADGLDGFFGPNDCH